MPEIPEDPFPSVSATLADARALDDQQLVEELTDVARSIRSLQAKQAAIITEVDSRIRALGYPMSGTAETVAVTLAMSPRSAEHLTDVSVELCSREAEAFMQALESLAASPECADPYQQGEDRTKEQRRADALAGFLAAHCTYRINVYVVIPADTLIGDNEYGAESKRLGPITSELARSLCFSPDARWRRLVTDPVSGSLVDLSAETYRIPERIRNAVKARDLTCRFPGCHRSAEFADCDHIVPWPRGTTRATDLAGLCWHHHRVKTHSAWTVEHDPSTPRHDMVWTSPLGTVHKTTAHNYHRRD